MTNSNPMFQHRHYCQIAATVRELNAAFQEVDYLAVMNRFADMFQRDNVRFDRARFIQACMGNPTGKDKRGMAR